jgi:AraC-like DNA-binding protein
MFNNTCKELPQGKIVMIPPNTPFISQMKNEFKQFYIHFVCSYPYDQCLPGIHIFTPTPAAEDLLNTIIPMIADDSIPPSTQLSMQIAALCHIGLSMPEDWLIPMHDPKHKILIAYDYIEKHYHRAISNDELAAQTRMARNSFIRLFRQETACSPQQYIRERRIRQACILLRFSSKTISEIAEECGFDNRYYFSRIFKQTRGYSPAEFRRLNFSDGITTA